MNALWGGMILLGIIYGSFTGSILEINEEILQSSKEAVSLCISMCGMLALWCGFLEIANQSGLILRLTGLMNPVIKFLYPNLPSNHSSINFISTNMISNILGLGWAATPAGLKAMEELEKLEEQRRKSHLLSVPKGTANDEMCTFLILNISSLQLIPINIIAYRSQYGSVHPTAIVGPGIAATLVSTITAVLFCKTISFLKNRSN